MARRLHPLGAMSPADSSSLDLSRTVDVCVCTFQRPAVAQLLASLGKQRLPEGWRLRVIVADNDDTPSARETVIAAFAANALEGTYLHAPARNISIARNACLDAAGAPFAAFIDDDEIARPDWLANLIHRLKASGAGVVFGRVTAVYAPDAPAWAVNGDMHSTEAFFRNGEIEGGYTCNVLLRRSAVGDLRFDPAFGRSGGEDTIFFGALSRNSVFMAYAWNAVVEEPVSPERVSIGWLTRRSFRSGQSYSIVLRTNGRNRAIVLVKSVLKIGFCVVAGFATMWSAVMWRRAAVRGVFHAGVLSGILGKKPLQLY
jgi:succinoglycan biosynthesis protein ExoM